MTTDLGREGHHITKEQEMLLKEAEASCSPCVFHGVYIMTPIEDTFLTQGHLFSPQ